MSRFKNTRVMYIAAMAVFGTIGVFVRNISISSGEIALYRAVIAIALIGGYFLFTGWNVDLKAVKKDIILLLISGIAMGANWILLFEAYKYTTVSIATLSYYFAPVIVMTVCTFVFKEKLSAKQIICFVMSTVGLLLVIGITNPESSGEDYVGVLYGLGAAVLYASVIIMNKFIKSIAGIERTFLQFIAAAVILVPYVACTSGMNLEKLDSIGWTSILIVGAVHTGAAYCLYFSSLKELSGQEAAILSYIDPLVAVITSVLILRESITAAQAIGGGLILLFTLWNEIRTKKCREIKFKTNR